MIRALILIFMAAFCIPCLAQVYCHPELEHSSKPLKAVVEKLALSNAAKEALSTFWRGNEVVVMCTAGAVLAYDEKGIPKTVLLSVHLRMARSFQLSDQFYFLVEGAEFSRLDSTKTEEYLAKWASSLRFRGAGALPRVDSISLISGLGKFRNSNPDESTLLSLLFRFETIPNMSLFLATWRSFPERPSAYGGENSGVLVSQNGRTGDVLVSDRLNLLEELILPLRTLKRP